MAIINLLHFDVGAWQLYILTRITLTALIGLFSQDHELLVHSGQVLLTSTIILSQWLFWRLKLEGVGSNVRCLGLQALSLGCAFRTRLLIFNVYKVNILIIIIIITAESSNNWRLVLPELRIWKLPNLGAVRCLHILSLSILLLLSLERGRFLRSTDLHSQLVNAIFTIFNSLYNKKRAKIRIRISKENLPSEAA